MKTDNKETAPKAAPPIGPEQLRKAMTIFERYRKGKQTLDARIVENERWYRDRYWNAMGNGDEQNPVSGWLFNSLANKHADAMDNFPEPNILPRDGADQPVAKLLSSVVPAILEQDNFETTYSRVTDYKLKAGTGVYGVFWDKEKLHGLGDITVKKCDVLNLFWKPGVADIQDSPHLFFVSFAENEQLKQEYPQLAGQLGNNPAVISDQYAYDQDIDTTEETVVMEWYYKLRKNGKTILHYCKFVGDQVLYATENDPAAKDTGWYAHGKYPFVFDPLFCVEKSPCGLSYVDIAKYTQYFIDVGDRAVLQNMLANSRPRHFYRKGCGIKPEDYMDLKKDLVPVEGNLDDNNIRPIEGKALPGIYLQVLNGKIDELKEVTGNRDVSTGGTSAGVTAAAAIAAMQEAGSKLSRDSNLAAYRAFRQVVEMVIELIRQFYELPRMFRIAGEGKTEEFIAFNNGDMLPRPLDESGNLWTPVFDLTVSASKKSPYSRMAQNELALQFFKLGFFNPELSEQALACLEMMDFDRKDKILRCIRENGRKAMEEAAKAAAQAAAAVPAPAAQTPVGEPGMMKQARMRVAEGPVPG